MRGPEVPQNNFQIQVGQNDDKLASEVSRMCDCFLSKKERYLGMRGEDLFLCVFNIRICTRTCGMAWSVFNKVHHFNEGMRI